MTMTRYGLLLAPGAGSDSTSSQLLAIEMAMPENVSVLRMDFPYRKAGRRAPDRQPVLVDAIRKEVVEFCRRAHVRPENLFLGGRSMGGRMCSIAVAEGLPAAGLILVSYPLHPSGKADRLRVDHFKDIPTPCLFISGTRDAFGTPDEFRRNLRRIRSSKRMRWIEGGDHGLKRHDTDVAAEVGKWITRLIG